MAKYHIADEYNHNRPSCAPYRADLLAVPAAEWINLPPSDQCQRCAKQRPGAIWQERRNRAITGADPRTDMLPLPDTDSLRYFVTLGGIANASFLQVQHAQAHFAACVDAARDLPGSHIRLLYRAGSVGPIAIVIAAYDNEDE